MVAVLVVRVPLDLLLEFLDFGLILHLYMLAVVLAVVDRRCFHTMVGLLGLF
jgi:hypothetical protein